MLMPNRVETTNRPGNFCVWTFAVWAPPACETVPKFKLRWPEVPPVKATPSGALTKLTEIAPSLADFMDMALEVRLTVLLRCVHRIRRAQLCGQAIVGAGGIGLCYQHVNRGANSESARGGAADDAGRNCAES